MEAIVFVSESDGASREFDDCFFSKLSSLDEAWFEVVTRLTASFGFEHVMFSVYHRWGMPLKSLFVRATYSEEWQEIYNQREYYRIDPALMYCLSHSTPLIWSSNTFKTDAQRAMYDEACHYGLRTGVALPIHGPQLQVGMFCLASNLSRDDFANNVSIFLPKLTMLRDQMTENSSRYLTMHVGSNIPKLTPRELECLKWTAHGKTTWEISRILDCSEDAVNFHIKNIRKKFEVPTRREAVIMAMHLGIISLD
ncbi:LuxR family transcriptional regulator [Burkholderia stabilis]|uniref:LuxR family transcriptional regulator n=1 Tax=Burkholderia stabilis TaxID=95485 RepID=A0A4Q2A940_9BURK|nr:LuxR family transcriptional regulator [Burkholderia stabilis]RXV65331.1 LuxR family transcriptional regulator [Burkholderia stabilis]